jgi:hypothetical protein
MALCYRIKTNLEKCPFEQRLTLLKALTRRLLEWPLYPVRYVLWYMLELSGIYK